MRHAFRPLDHGDCELGTLEAATDWCRRLSIEGARQTSVEGLLWRVSSTWKCSRASTLGFARSWVRCGLAIDEIILVIVHLTGCQDGQQPAVGRPYVILHRLPKGTC